MSVDDLTVCLYMICLCVSVDDLSVDDMCVAVDDLTVCLYMICLCVSRLSVCL